MVYRLVRIAVVVELTYRWRSLVDELSALPLAGNRVRSGSLQSGLRSVVLGEGVFGHSPRVVAPYSLFLPSVTDLLIGVVRLKCPPIVGMK